MRRGLLYLTVVYLLGLFAIWTMIRIDDDSHPIVTLFLLSPRWIVGLPLLLLVPATLVFRPRLTLSYALHLTVITFPILGFEISSHDRVPSVMKPQLTLMTCNLGGGKIQPADVVDLVRSNHIHVLMLQECPPTIAFPIFRELGWTHRQAGNMAIGSIFSISKSRILAQHPESRYHAVAAMECQVTYSAEQTSDTPPTAHEFAHSVRLICVHLPTFRPALQQVRDLDLNIGPTLESIAFQYHEIADSITDEIQRRDGPVVIAGDFNVPVESAYYRGYWDRYQNAYSAAGTGLGYTKYTRVHGVRIDHILADDDWSIAHCSVGPNLGSDHRPVIAELRYVGDDSFPGKHGTQ